MKSDNIAKKILMLFCIPVVCFSQTGPGGVRKNDGTSALILWLDANQNPVVASGTGVTTWQDKSGYGNDLTAGVGATYINPAQNTYPAFRFNGTTQYFERAYTAQLQPTTKVYNIFSATNVTSSAAYKCVISNRNDGNLFGYILYSVPTTNVWEHWTGRNASTWDVLSSGVSTAGRWSGQKIEYAGSGANLKKASINQAADVTATNTFSANTTRVFRVGAGQNEGAANFFFRGDIGEIMVFNAVLNNAEKIIINNYLSSKYNYTLSANDKYGGDAPGTDFDFGVGGIGQESGTTNLAFAPSVSNGFGLTYVSGFQNGDYIFAGHNLKTGNDQQTTDIGVTVGSLSARWIRIWNVDVTNAGIAIVTDVNFDMSDGGVSVVPATPANYVLLYRAINSGDWTKSAIIPTIAGDVITFPNVTLADGYYTIGTLDKAASPLPVELLEFSARNTSTGNKLNWITASEKNNDYFEIERSNDGINFELLESIDSKASNGNSLQKLAYETIDSKPHNGINYYRLKQIDFSKTLSYSKIIDVATIQETNISFNIFPNPNNGDFSISLTGSENNYEIEVSIIDCHGKIVSNKKTNVESINNLSFTINSKSTLSAGLYHVLFSMDGINYNNRLVIE